MPLVARLGLPDDCGPWSIQRLSTGAAAIGAYAALMLRSRVLLLDEPTSAFDSASAAAVEALIAERVSDGTSVLWSTHDDAHARHVGTGIFAMRPDGGIEERGVTFIQLSYGDLILPALLVVMDGVFSPAEG